MVAATVDIPTLKARHPLGDTVEASGVRLRGRGRVRQGFCPFHDETEGSFTVYADTERWYCFGCGLGGDVLDFIRRVDNLSLHGGTSPPGESAPVQLPDWGSVTRRGAVCGRPSNGRASPPAGSATVACSPSGERNGSAE